VESADVKQVDTSLHKKYAIRESMKLEFWVETFNVVNHPILTVLHIRRRNRNSGE